MTVEKTDDTYKWLALLVVVLGTFMAILSNSIVNIAIPTMMSVFNVSVDDARWVVTAYSLTLGAVIPLTGYLTDMFGTKKLYIFAVASFTVGSFLCVIAWSNNIMITFRVIQALGGGMIMPVGMSIIYQIFPKEERGMALGFWGIASMAAPAIGPTLSGYIIQYLNWRFIFTINIPIGIVSVLVAFILLKPFPSKPRESFDYIGFISSTVGIVFCLYVLGEGSSIDWGDISNLLLITIGIFSLIIFVINELLHPEPLLNLRLFKISDFSLSVVISSVLSMALFGVTFIVPLFLQSLKGLTAMQTGLLMFPAAIATALTMPISGKLFDKFGARPLVIPGLFIIGYGTYKLCTLSLDTSNNEIIILLAVRGIGLGLAMMPATTFGMNAVPQALIAEASALSNTIRQMAGALSVTILTNALQWQLNVSYAKMAEQVNPFNFATTSLLQLIQGALIQTGLSSSQAYSLSLTYMSGLIQKNAYIDGINFTLLIATFFAVIAIPLALFIKGEKQKKPIDEKHEEFIALDEALLMEEE